MPSRRNPDSGMAGRQGKRESACGRQNSGQGKRRRLADYGKAPERKAAEAGYG